MLNPSHSERMFALLWWKQQDAFFHEIMQRKYFPSYSTAAINMSTSCIVKIYQKENQ